MVAGPEVISKATSSIKHVFLCYAELEQFGESQTIFSVTVSFHCNNFSSIYFFKIAREPTMLQTELRRDPLSPLITYI